MPRIGDDLKARNTLIAKTADKTLQEFQILKRQVFDYLKQYPGSSLHQMAEDILGIDRPHRSEYDLDLAKLAQALKQLVDNGTLAREQRGYIIKAIQPAPVITPTQYSPPPAPAARITPAKYSLPRRQDRVEARSKALQVRRLLRVAKTLLDYCERIADARKMHPEDRDVWTVEQLLGWGMPVRQTTAAVRSSSRTPSVRGTQPALDVSASLSARHSDAVKTHVAVLLRDLQGNPGAYSINDVITRLNRALYS